jgi:hypothetical protein
MVDKHVVKMILETAQLLSTAHRVLDGVESIDTSTGRKKKVYKLNDDRDLILYSATHINHPSAIWVRQTHENSRWLQAMLVALCGEYSYRYGKIHKSERDGLVDQLAQLPNLIPFGTFTEPTPAMPDEVKIAGDSIKSYRNYYINNKTHLASWKKRSTPGWYNANI